VAMSKTVVFERKEIETIIGLNKNSDIEDVEEFKYLGRLPAWHNNHKIYEEKQ